MAKEELVTTWEVQKRYINMKCRLWRFAIGDKCLVLLLTMSNKLLVQWK